jgi:hypothetical protein
VLLGTALLLLAHITGRARAEMLTEFWQPFAISTRDAASFFGDLADFQRYTFARLLHGGGLHVGPLPGAAWASAGLAALGVLELWRSHQRTELVAGAAVLVAAIAASAAGHIPLGALRTDLFLLPFFAVLLACGVLAIARSAAAESFARREGVALALSAVIGAQIFEAPTARYPLEQAVAPAAKLARRFEPGDGLATNLHGSFALGTYWPGPLDFRDDARFAIPHPEPRVQSFTILDDASYRRVGTLPQAEGPQRLWVFLCHFQPDLLADLLARMEAETPYERAGTWRSKGCGLWLFEQPVVEPAATQPPALTLRRPPP